MECRVLMQVRSKDTPFNLVKSRSTGVFYIGPSLIVYNPRKEVAGKHVCNPGIGKQLARFQRTNGCRVQREEDLTSWAALGRARAATILATEARYTCVGQTDKLGHFENS